MVASEPIGETPEIIRSFVFNFLFIIVCLHRLIPASCIFFQVAAGTSIIVTGTLIEEAKDLWERLGAPIKAVKEEGKKTVSVEK